MRRARRSAAIVVAIIHAGAEGADRLHTPRGTQFFLGENRGNARAFAHAMINAGASIVFGSGPHVIRGIERYRGHLIAYSLGECRLPHARRAGRPVPEHDPQGGAQRHRSDPRGPVDLDPPGRRVAAPGAQRAEREASREAVARGLPHRPLRDPTRRTLPIAARKPRLTPKYAPALASVEGSLRRLRHAGNIAVVTAGHQSTAL